MPLFSYRCPEGHTDEDLVRQGKAPADSKLCACGGMMERDRVYPVTTIGPVWSNTEQYEGALLSPGQRAAGARIRGPRELSALEQKLGVVPMASDSPMARAIESRSRDYSDTFDRIAREEGVDAALTYEAVEETVAAGASLPRHELKGIIEDQEEGLRMMEDGRLTFDEDAHACSAPAASAALVREISLDLGLADGPSDHAAGPA